jgi:hypothetical protein
VSATGDTRVAVPPNSLPPALAGRDVALVLRQTDPTTVPAPPSGTFFIRAIEINVLVDGTAREVTFTNPVTLTFTLTTEDLALAGGDPAKLVVLRRNPITRTWDQLTTTFVESPPPARLEAVLLDFSVFAIGVVGPRPIPTAAATPTPGPTPTPTATSAPTPTATSLPSPTPAPVATATPVPPEAPAVEAPAPGAAFPIAAIIGIVLGVIAVIAAASVLYLWRTGRIFQGT